jgi:uncharacterized protein (DUF2147 family)
MSVKITCINKSNGNHSDPYEAISHYGWIEDGTNKPAVTDRQTLVNWMKNGGAAYVQDKFGKVYCKVNTSIKGTEFLQTYSDGRYTDNLLSLFECK